jgi:Ca-activated chloride channel family protein
MSPISRSVDSSLLLQSGTNVPYDAVWPANSLRLELGDVHRVVKHARSIHRSPVVFANRKPIAPQLGWVNNPDVTVQDFLAAAEAGEFRFAMTSATQSNSGASAYLGFQYALAAGQIFTGR